MWILFPILINGNREDRRKIFFNVDLEFSRKGRELQSECRAQFPECHKVSWRQSPLMVVVPSAG